LKSASLVILLLLTRAAAETRSAGEPVIAFVTNRDSATGDRFLDSEIYLMGPDGTDAKRLTNNTVADGFPAQSPDGRRIIFDTNRQRTDAEAVNTSDLFVMNTDGSNQTFLTRGSSATWSPDGKQIAFHRSASGSGQPIKPDPGAATYDSDIFVMSIDQKMPRNLTNSPSDVDDDADWSPSGNRIVFTSHRVDDNPVNSVTAEIYVRNADGSGQVQRLTNNSEEERGPSWSRDGKRIVYSCRRAGSDFEICVMNADGSGQKQLTDNEAPDLSAVWSPDGTKIAFHRRTGDRLQVWTMNADGSAQTQLTRPPGDNAFPNWIDRSRN
jgi:Tol biopolymer transport system component